MAYKIGEKIKQYRVLREYSQKEFAQKIGVSSSRVSNWEQGLYRPDVDILANICTVLNVSPSELLDIHLDNNELTSQEYAIISAYRERVDLQHAVNILLGIESY